MIRYAKDRQALLDEIEVEKPGWTQRASQRTQSYIASRDYTGGSDFWGEIKRVYVRLQKEKCAYCETKLQGIDYGSKVHEVEHFRPKSSVKAWPDPALKHLQGWSAPCPTGNASAKGYYALAYHPFNYAIACTRCNSTLKSNYFPIRGPRKAALGDPSLGSSEDALLVYPIADLDDDPATLITFAGVLATPVATAGPLFERAAVTIAFFDLNHEDLTTRRAERLWPLWVNLETRATSTSSSLRDDASLAIRRACRSAGEFSACMSAFVALYEQDRARAKVYADAARDLVPE